MIGKYVKYKGKTYLVCGMRRRAAFAKDYAVKLIGPDSQAKVEVNAENVTILTVPAARETFWQDGRYLVTGKGRILSLKTQRWMEWPEMHGGRLEILKQAGVGNLKRCYQCDKPTQWLAPDARCGKCTRMTPEEVAGEPA